MGQVVAVGGVHRATATVKLPTGCKRLEMAEIAFSQAGLTVVAAGKSKTFPLTGRWISTLHQMKREGETLKVGKAEFEPRDLLNAFYTEFNVRPAQ